MVDSTNQINKKELVDIDLSEPETPNETTKITGDDPIRRSSEPFIGDKNTPDLTEITIDIPIDPKVQNNQNDQDDQDKHVHNNLCPQFSEESVDKFVFPASIITLIVTFGILCIFSFEEEEENVDRRFWWNQLAKQAVFFIINTIAGCLVKYKEVKIGYTRKLVHFSFFLAPQLFDKVIMGFNETLLSQFWTAWIIFFSVFLVTEKIRKRVPLFELMFKAIDRPEDRPFTLIWLFIQIFFALLVIIPFVVIFNHLDRVNWIFVPILINGVGDGLAEPVGIRFGKHKYYTKCAFCDKKYVRSYEGSSAVYITSLVVVSAFYNDFNTTQFILTMVLLPPIMTITEAKAPHTMDTPFLYLTGCVFLFLIHWL
jgi:phytol kinase